jgi:cell division protein FtsL
MVDEKKDVNLKLDVGDNTMGLIKQHTPFFKGFFVVMAVVVILVILFVVFVGTKMLSMF